MKKFINDIFILFLLLIINCFLSLYAFKIPVSDFYIYHYHNGWSLLNNRISTDYLPYLFQGFLNPFLDSFLYFSIEKLNNHPVIFTLFWGIKYTLFMFVAYKIYSFIFRTDNTPYSTLFCMILAGFSPILIYLVNFDFNDIQTGIIVLLGIYIYLKNIFNSDYKYRFYFIFISGLLLGLAFGLNYTCISFVIGIILTTLFLNKKIDNMLKHLIFILGGIFCGFLITGGSWIALLYYNLKIPVSSYFNHIFNSHNTFLISDYFNFRPTSLMDFIFYPLKNRIVNEMFDLKFCLGFISCIIAFCISKKGNFEKIYSNIININIFYFLLFFVIFTYYINLFFFTDYRYITPLYVLSAGLICMLLKILSKERYYKYIFLVILMLFIFTKNDFVIQSSTPFNINKIINIPNLKFEDNAVIFCADAASCYFAPTQNNRVRYIEYAVPTELNSNLYSEKMIKDIFDKEQNVYIFFYYENLTPYLKRLYQKSLLTYTNKNIDIDKCDIISSEIFGEINNNLIMCKLK